MDPRRLSSSVVFLVPFSLALLTVLPLGQGQRQRQANSKLLCERIADQCRESCQLYWDQCHTGQASGQVGGQVMMPMPGGGQVSIPVGTGQSGGDISLTGGGVDVPIPSQTVTVLGATNSANPPQSPQRPPLYPVISNSRPILGGGIGTTINSSPPKTIHPVITKQHLNPLRNCMDYMQECDEVLHPCCGRYNCRYHAGQSGFGRCH